MRGDGGAARMTPKLGSKLEYNAATLAALAKWADIGAKKPKRDYRKWPKQVDPRKRIKERVSSS